MTYSADFGGLHPGLKPYAEYAMQIANYNGIKPVVTSVARTWADQAKLYARYIAGQSKYPANAPGDSAHQPRTVAGLEGALAFDSVVPDAQLATWTAIRRYVGFRVPENDLIHAELPEWRSYV